MLIGHWNELGGEAVELCVELFMALFKVDDVLASRLNEVLEAVEAGVEVGRDGLGGLGDVGG